jgi:hypothetical protein
MSEPLAFNPLLPEVIEDPYPIYLLRGRRVRRGGSPA